MIRYEYQGDVVVLTMDDPSSGANTMNDAYGTSMRATLDRLEAERDVIAGVVLMSAKKTWFAGAHLKDLQAITSAEAGGFFERVEGIKGDLRRLERLGRPVVAALNGTALGGGFEIALACHRRIAVADEAARFGLPEVTLGLLPGGGGITRLVRMLGIVEALTGWLLEGATRSPAETLAGGLIDELVSSREELLPAAIAWIRSHREHPEAAATKPWDAPGYRMPGGAPTSSAVAAILPALPARLRARLKGADLPAPRAILCAAVEGAAVDVAAAGRIETRYLTELVTGRVAKAMIQAFFFDLQAIGSGANRPAGVERRAVGRVGVVGAGMMGAGIAYACASRGVDVVLKDVTRERAEHGRSHSQRVLARRIAAGTLDQGAAAQIVERITATEVAIDLADVDVVIEAVYEDLDLKRAVFAEVEAVTSPATLLCSNTSTLPITVLQAGVARPADVVGLHFFSPVERMRLVEIVRGDDTCDESVARAVDLVQQIGKVPIVVGDGRGFYTSRVFGTLVMEAATLVGEGVDPMTVERAATMAGFPASPLAMLDEVSLTLIQHIRAEAASSAASSGASSAASGPPGAPVLLAGPGADVIDEMVDLHARAGRAAGGGFYDYPPGEAKRLWPGLRERYTTGTQVPLKDLQDRYLFVMALETARCFAEGVLRDTPSANVGGLLGIGFPPATGGPATFMTNYDGGLRGFVARADALADAHGERFRPSPWLRDRAAAGGGLLPAGSGELIDGRPTP